VEIVILLLLIVLNGVLAMSEIAVVSSRRARLQQQAADGSARARAALKLADNPNRFLSTVQIGITLIGILAGAFGGATVAADLSEFLTEIEVLAPYSDVLGVGIVVLMITYLSLIIGELVPKRLAIHSPETIAKLVAGPMRLLSIMAYPLVWFLGMSTEIVLRVLGVEDSDDPPVTEEEIKTMLQEGARAGIFDTAEHQMVAGVFRLDDLRADALMTPRTEMAWLDADDTVDLIRKKIAETAFSIYPVCEGSPENVLGIVLAKDMLRRSLINGSLDLRTMTHQVLFVPEGMLAADILEAFRGEANHFAMVLGEHGDVDGLLTMHDILEAVVGDIEEPAVVQREDGSWLVDGMMPIEEFKAQFGIKVLPDEQKNLYQTLAGFIITTWGRIPNTADHFVWDKFYFEVVDMDSNRVDKVLVRLNHDNESEGIAGQQPLPPAATGNPEIRGT
jgi:putative hemolysin